MKLQNGSWKYDEASNSFIPLILEELKVDDIIFSYHNERVTGGLQRVLRVWIDDYKQVCYSLNTIL